MRSISLVKRLEFDFACGEGVLRDAIAIGDIDNDGNNELCVGNTNGELVVFKKREQWQKITNLGMVTCITIGDVLNCGQNSLIVIGGEGWCRIFNFQPSQQNSSDNEQSPNSHANKQLECVHIQRIPANTKVVLLGDIDNDGCLEMVLALTDRVVRSYRWCKNGESKEDDGKLVCLYKWESGHQIGTISLQHSLNNSPAILVAQPGGTFMRIKYNEEEKSNQTVDSASEVVATFKIDYQFLGISRMRNPNVSTEILGNLKTNHTEDVKTNPYAVATLDGTIMLVRDEIIIWAIQVDHQIFALEKLDINKDGAEEIIACSWDGQTYMLDQNKNSVRFQLDEPVQAFCCGYYSVNIDHPPLASLVYVTFKNKIYIYYDLEIKNMVAKKFNVDDSVLQELRNKYEWAKDLPKKTLIEYVLYGNFN